MKVIFSAVLTFSLLFGFTNLYSQSKYKTKKFNASVQAGSFIPFGDAADAYKMGFNTGFDFGYKVKSNVDVFLNLNYNFLSFKSSVLTNATPHILEVTLGSRYYFGAKSKNQFFGEAGLGLYSFGASSYSAKTTILVPVIDPKTGDTTYTSSTTTRNFPSSSSSDFGINAGFGDLYQVSNDVGVYLKTDFHIVFTSGSSTTYMGIYGGAKINF